MYNSLTLKNFLVVSLLTAATAPAHADFPTPEDINGYYDNAETVRKETKGMLDNARACEAQGVDKDTCASIAAFCYFQDQYFSKAYPNFVNQLQVFDSFKIDCGQGDCYQCCYVPNKGCHSSFKGKVTINCNPLYGAGTRRAGDTFVINPQPGKPCLYLPQTCEHIPLCYHNGKTDIAALEKKLDGGAPHTLKLKGAKDNRARKLAESIVGCCYEYVNKYSTEKTSLAHLADTLTGRGCKGWRTNVTKTWPMDNSVSAFEVLNVKTKKPSLPASQVNYLVQLCTRRVLASFPNLRTRLDYTDSKVWATKSKASYLAKVSDVDKSFLTYASSHALSMLKCPTEIQDYRLLAIPRPGEQAPGKVYNGCSLGTPPRVALAYTQDGNAGIKLQVKVADPESPALSQDNPVTVLWGDGQVSHGKASGTTKSTTLSHSYQLGGKYIVWVVAANDSGLRGVTAIMVETSATAGVKATPSSVPSLGRVVLEGVNFTEKSLSGNNFVYYLDFSLHDQYGKEVQFGRSRALTVPLNKTTAFGDVTGHNTSGVYTTKVSIRPRGTIGFAIGLSEMYFTTKKIRLEVFNTETGKFDSISLYPQAKDIKVYPKGSTTPVAASALGLDQNNLLKFPIFTKKNYNWVATERIDIEITLPMFSQYKIGATANKLAAGSTKAWIETRPGVLVPVPVCGNKITESGEECDDGNSINGDGCTTSCKLEKTGGVLSFTAQRATGMGVILTWKTKAVTNCKTFQVLRCAGASCSGVGTHKPLSTIGVVACKYGAGPDTYQFLDTSAAPLPQISYYLQQSGINSAVTNHGPAIVPAVPPDLGPPDLGPDLAQPDLGPDLAQPDLAQPDLAQPDLGPDLAQPDLAQPDLAQPDMVQTDKGQPDLVKTDSSTTDKALPDSASADSTVVDAQAPDSSVARQDQTGGNDTNVKVADAATDGGSSGSGGKQGGCSGGCEMSSPASAGSGVIWVLLGLLMLCTRRRS